MVYEKFVTLNPAGPQDDFTSVSGPNMLMVGQANVAPVHGNALAPHSVTLTVAVDPPMV